MDFCKTDIVQNNCASWLNRQLMGAATYSILYIYRYIQYIWEQSRKGFCDTSQRWFKEAALPRTAHRDRRQAGFALPSALRWWGRGREWKPARSHPNSRLWTAKGTFSYSAARPQLSLRPFVCFVLLPGGEKKKKASTANREDEQH